MNKIFYMGTLFLFLHVYASIEDKIEKSLCVLRDNANIVLNIIDDSWHRVNFMQLHVEDLRALQRMCELIIEDDNCDLFTFLLILTEEKTVRIEKNVELFISTMFDHAKDHPDDEEELEKTMLEFRQGVYNMRRATSKLLFILHKNRFIAPYLCEKLEEYITEISHEIDDIYNEIDAQDCEVTGNVNTY